MKNATLITLIFFLFLIFSVPGVIASPLDMIFEPMRHIDIEDFYDNYHEMIDLVIFFVIFTGVSQAVFRKRFPGNPGKAMSVAIGLALSFSLVIAEHYTGFSLKSLGTIAGTILILLLAAMIFYLLKMFGVGSVTAGATAIIITYLSIRTTTPQTYNWMQANQIAPWIDLLLIITLIVGFLKLIQTITSPKSIPLRKAEPQLQNKNQNREPLPLLKKDAEELKNEKWAIKKNLRKNTKKGQKDEKNVTRKLYHILNLLRTSKLTSEARKQFQEDLRGISVRESDLQKRLNSIKQIDQELKNFDFEGFDTLKRQCDQLDEEGRKRLRQLIQQERVKIGAEQKIQELQEKINQQDQLFRRNLNQAINLLNQGKNPEATQSIKEAISLDQQADYLWDKLKRLENVLLNITKKELRELNKPK